MLFQSNSLCTVPPLGQADRQAAVAFLETVLAKLQTALATGAPADDIIHIPDFEGTAPGTFPVEMSTTERNLAITASKTLQDAIKEVAPELRLETMGAVPAFDQIGSTAVEIQNLLKIYRSRVLGVREEPSRAPGLVLGGAILLALVGLGTTVYLLNKGR